LVIRNTNTLAQSFLQGHKGDVTCVTVSPDGRFIASGEENASGKASIILWDIAAAIANGNSANRDGEKYGDSMDLHRGKVQALDFSADSRFLASVGGQDDNSLVVWRVSDQQAMSGEKCGPTSTNSVKWFNNRIECNDGKADARTVQAGESAEYRLATCSLSGKSRIWPVKPKVVDSAYGEGEVVSMKICSASEVVISRVKRDFTCVALSPDDRTLLLGTTSGDILACSVYPWADTQRAQQNEPYGTQASLDRVIASQGKGAAPKHSQFQKAVLVLKVIPTPDIYANETESSYCIVAGGGGGKLAIIAPDEGIIAARAGRAQRFGTQLQGGVNNIAIEAQSGNPGSTKIWIATQGGNVYEMDLHPRSPLIADAINADFDRGCRLCPELTNTSHTGRITDVVFPKDCSDLFITSSHESIRVWNTALGAELLRIQIPNIQCECITINDIGTVIVSGWSDGAIRGFYPESGRLAFVVTNAHMQSCLSIAACTSSEDMYGQLAPLRLVSGGKDGRVRVWDVNTDTGTSKMLASVKEHRSAVTAIAINSDNTAFMSSSLDGSCLGWKIGSDCSVHRQLAMFASTNFHSVVYHPDESQILTCGTDRKITYYDMSDGECIRMLPGSDPGKSGGGIRSLDIQPDGELFVSAGDDKLVRVYNYDEGDCIAIGDGHSGNINAVKISPDQKFLVSVGDECGVMIWEMPQLR